MLSLQQIEQQYPDALKSFKRNILREYLQVKILEIIFASPYASRLSFLGGTALRIVYRNSRFSEDLDFDNFDLKDTDFDGLASAVVRGLELQGLTVEMNTVKKGAYQCNIRLPGILFSNNLSTHHDEKILIQIDSAPHHFAYTPDTKIINMFDVFSEIFVTPQDILLSQKINAIFSRKRAKGRDFHDVVFMLSFTKPNYGYLSQKFDIDNGEKLRKKIIAVTADFDFKELARDVQPFLFKPEDARKVELFRDYIAQASLS